MIIRFPVDLLLLGFDACRGIVVFFIRLSKPDTTACPYCFDLSTAGSRVRECTAADKYANFWLFRTVCPCAENGDDGVLCRRPDQYRNRLWPAVLVGLLYTGIGLSLGLVLVHQRHDLSKYLLSRPTAVTPPPATPDLDAQFGAELKRAELLMDNQPAAAQLILKQINAQAPTYRPPYLMLARSALKGGRKGEACHRLEAATHLKDDDPLVHLVLARLRIDLNQQRRALESITRLDQLAPSEPWTQLVRAYYYSFVGLSDRARHDLKYLGPDQHAYLQQEASHVRRMLRDIDADEVVTGSIPEGDEIARWWALAGSLASVVLPEERAGLLMSLGEQIKEAEAVGSIPELEHLYERYLDVEPDVLISRKQALLYYRTGRIDQATQAARRLVESEDTERRLAGHQTLGEIYLGLGSFSEAFEQAGRMLALDGTNLDAHLIQAHALRAQGKDRAVETKLREILLLEPGHLQALLSLADLYRKTERNEKALLELKKARSVHADAPEPLMATAAYYLSNQDARQAIAQYRLVLERHPKYSGAMYPLALLLAEDASRLDEALEWAIQFAQVDQNQAASDHLLGWIYYKQGRHDQGFQMMRENAMQLGHLAAVHYHLAVAFLDRGKPGEARRRLEQALSLAREFPGSDQAEKILKELP